MKTLIALWLLAATPLAACLWDYDTLAQESRGMGDLKAVIVGGFARNPALYYEMRLERVTRLLKDNSDDLDAYDAAGVACDRRGRADEAIEWMARKLAAMDRMGYDGSKHAQPNHRYRYLANLGTFHAHRWFKNGANREAMDDMQRGRELIAQAIKENPDAHFGREKYQLMIMDWVIALKPFDESIVGPDGKSHKQWYLPNCLGIDLREVSEVRQEHSRLPDLGLEGAVEGLSGLVAMGTAWESVDVFYGLALAIQATGRTSLAVLALERCKELIRNGRTSTVPKAPAGEELIALMSARTEAGIFGHIIHGGDGEARAGYRSLRGQADRWHEARTDYVLTRLGRGEHPDTHPDFWSDFSMNQDHMPMPEPGLVDETVNDFRSWLRRPGSPFAILAGGVVISALTAIFLLRLIRRRKARNFATPRG